MYRLGRIQAPFGIALEKNVANCALIICDVVHTQSSVMHQRLRDKLDSIMPLTAFQMYACSKGA